MERPARKYPSGWAKEKQRRAREREALIARAVELGLVVTELGATPTAAGQPPPEEALVVEARKLGPAPIADPIAVVVWASKLGALVAWDAAVGPMNSAAGNRRRATLDAIRTIGMTNSQAVTKDRLLRIERRLGLVEQEKPDALEERPINAPPALRDRGGGQ